MLDVVSERFFTALSARLGEGVLARDEDTRAQYGTDWTRVHPPRPSAVVFPRSTEEVSEILRLCEAHRVPVVPSGGRTGLAAGAVATRGEVVLSLERMRRIDPVDDIAGTVRVDAGAVTEAVHRHCEEAGFRWPIDLASKGSCQIGGNLATNAGGLRVIRYGPTREWVLGLTCVLMGGRVLTLGGALEKNNTGYDLKQLLIGSEGTLGVITEAVLKLAPPPGPASVLFFALEGPQRALELLATARRAGLSLMACELLTDACLAEVEARGHGRSPFVARARAYALLEVEIGRDEAALDGWLADVTERGVAKDGVRAASAQQARALWALRENITASLAVRDLVHKSDVAVPVSRVAAFVEDLEGLFAARHPELDLFLFGHVGDGNVHINLPRPPALEREAFLARLAAVDEDVGALLQRHGGSVSAEHGIGLLKRSQLRFTRSADEIALFHAIKKAFDPLNLMNPGKILEPHR